MKLSDRNNPTDSPPSAATIVPEAATLAAGEEPIQQQLDVQSPSSSVSHVSVENTSPSFPAWRELIALVQSQSQRRSVPERVTESTHETVSKEGMISTNDTNFSKQLSQITSRDSDEFMKIVDTLFGKHSDDIGDVLSGHKGRNKKVQRYDYLYFIMVQMSSGLWAKIGMTSIPDISRFSTQYVRNGLPIVCIRFKLAHSKDGVPFFRKKMLESFVLDLVGDPRARRFYLLIVCFAFSLLRSRSASQVVRYCGRRH